MSAPPTNVRPELVTRYDVDDVEMAVLEAGDGGRPLLLVHGFTGSKEDFGDEIERLAARGHHVVAPDLRGHGGSSRPTREDDYDFDIFARDVLRLADVLGWDSFDLLGHSMGGMVAQVIVVQHQDRVGRLVLMDTAHGPLHDIDPMLVELGLELARAGDLATIQAFLKAGTDPLANPAHRRVCDTREGYEAWSEAKMLATSHVMYAAMLARMTSAEDRLDDLARIEVPALVLVGELDRAFVEPSRRIAATLRNARLEVLPGGGHSPQFEATAAWRAAIDEFFEP